MAVTLVGSSFLIKELTCKALSGSRVEINLADRGSEGLVVQGGKVIELVFEQDGCRIPLRVEWIELRGLVVLSDGTRARFKSREPLSRLPLQSQIGGRIS